MSDWELLKENVEPIKSGRSMKTLKSALTEKPNELTERELKRKEFESDLRTYVGDDLLSVYYSYIVWVEQNYPLGGNEANLKTLLENCIEQFYSTDQYRNDERLLEIFLKFIKRVDSPLELFTFFHENQFATKLSQFYINWSFHLENHKNCRKAADVLKEGIEENAQPFAAIKTALEELEVRVAKAIVNDQIQELNENDAEDHRKPLNGLKPKKKKGKTVAPVKRIGAAIKNAGEGLKTSAVNTKQNKTPVIYCDENDPEVEPIQPRVTRARPEGSQNVKAVVTVGQENQQKPGKWTENQLHLKQAITETQPKFEIHADDSDDDYEAVRKPPQSNTLKVRPRGADSPPIARFEKPDPKKIFYFNQNKVYAGAEEFSFEEIRGRKWMAKQKREEVAIRSRKLEEEVAQLRAQVEMLLKSQQFSQKTSQQIVANTERVVASPPPSSADSSNAKSLIISSGDGTKAANSMMRDLWNGTLGNQTTDFHQPNGALDINAVLEKGEEQLKKNKPSFAIYSDISMIDKSSKPMESNGFVDYTIAMPKSEQTFFANTGMSSTPMADKSKKSFEINTNAIESIQANYNFVGGLTAKLLLSPIVESSREYNSKSSSSSSGKSSKLYFRRK